MKKIGLFRFTIFLSVFLLASIVTPLIVNADVIWEPNDDFYRKQYDSCNYVGRSYLANGSEGYITIYESPKSSRIIKQFENGNRFYVSFTYKDSKGAEWGVVQFTLDEDKRAVQSYSKGGITGWIPMKDLLVCYDHYSFCDEYGDEFQEYEGGFDAHAYEGKIVFWTYPGSGVIYSTTDMSSWEEDINFNHIYTDENGLQWGYVGYFYANRGWVCMSDPTNDNLPVKEVVYEDLIPAAKPVRPAVSGGMMLIIGLVVGLVILTAVLIGVLYRRKRG